MIHSILYRVYHYTEYIYLSAPPWIVSAPNKKILVTGLGYLLTFSAFKSGGSATESINNIGLRTLHPNILESLTAHLRALLISLSMFCREVPEQWSKHSRQCLCCWHN